MTTGQDDMDQQVAQEKAINEEYKIWKKNSPFLYEYMFQTNIKSRHYPCTRLAYTHGRMASRH